MIEFPLIFTAFMILLGPFRLIPSFAAATQGMDKGLRRRLAVWGIATAAILCAFVALAGQIIMRKFGITIDAVRIAGGLVLLISALEVIFHKAEPAAAAPATRSINEVITSPAAIPNIVPPAGIAAILICMMLASQYPEMALAVGICLVIVMALNFLVMYFIGGVVKIPGLGVVLKLLGSVLAFVQVALAIKVILVAFSNLGVVQF